MTFSSPALPIHRVCTHDECATKDCFNLYLYQYISAHSHSYWSHFVLLRGDLCFPDYNSGQILIWGVYFTNWLSRILSCIPSRRHTSCFCGENPLPQHGSGKSVGLQMTGRIIACHKNKKKSTHFYHLVNPFVSKPRVVSHIGVGVLLGGKGRVHRGI